MCDIISFNYNIKVEENFLVPGHIGELELESHQFDD